MAAKKHGPRTKHKVRERPLIPKKAVNQKFSVDMLLRINDLYRSGTLSDDDICEAIGVNRDTFNQWLKKSPELKKLRSEAKKNKFAGMATERFIEYVFDRLPPDLREYWKELESYENEPTVQQKIEALFARAGMRARQHLFIHALVACNFNVNFALNKLNIDRKTFDNWMTDPCFNDLYNEMLWYKKNFIESMLMNLIKVGDTQAIIFANKTLNADRGYNPAKQVDVSGKIEHKDTIDLDKLPLAIRKQLLDHFMTQQNPPAVSGPQVIIEPITNEVQSQNNGTV